MNYKEDIKIDETMLDVECLDQPKIMLRWTEEQAELQREEELAKERLDLLKAELDKDIRSDPDKYEMDKVTEGAINNTIILNPEVKAATQTYINARFENNVAKGVVKSMDQRKQMLEGLIRLHGQQYFAGPKVLNELSFKLKEKEESKKITRKVGRKLKDGRKTTN